MKKVLVLLAGGLILLAFPRCSNTETQPFDAEFTGVYTSVVPDSVRCGPGLWANVIVDCKGNAEVLGDFICHFDFCADGEGHYPGTGMTAYMVAECGDTLFIEGGGQVMEGRLEEHPDHVISYWRDPFKILGGTGKFEGATGSGMTDDYNSIKDENSHHHWVGTITLVKGNKII